jgi:transposase
MKEEVSDASTPSTRHPRVPGGGCALGPDQRAFRREVAADLGIGLSTLRNGIDRRRERPMEPPPDGRQEDRAAELKRLRRANEGLRQEREILKRATALFAKEGSR